MAQAKQGLDKIETRLDDKFGLFLIIIDEFPLKRFRHVILSEAKNHIYSSRSGFRIL